jgi:hypothetical protein
MSPSTGTTKRWRIEGQKMCDEEARQRKGRSKKFKGGKMDGVRNL